ARRIDERTAAGAYTNRLFNDFVDEWAKARPEKTAIVDARSRYSYGELRARAETAALGFLDCGIRRGDVVTVQLPNWHEFIIVVGDGGPRHWTSWDELLDRGAGDDRLRGLLGLLRPGPNDVIELMFTSGTTGEPKGVMHTANTISAAVEPVERTLGTTASDVC